MHREDDDRIDAAGAVREQTGTAEAGLFDDASSWLHMPWSTVDALVGGIGAGHVWFVGGFSGHGKTTFLMDLTRRMLHDNRTVYYCGTETVDHELRTRLACQRVGVYSGHVLTGATRGWTDWPEIRAKLVTDIRAQRTLGDRERFLVAPVQRIAARELTGAFHDAAIQQADVLIIDHIDHIAHGQGRSGFEDSRMLAHLVLDLAQSTGIRVIVATQFNNESGRGDRLGTFQPPQPHYVYMGGHKRQIAWGMLGLFKPIRDDLTADELKAARAGKLKPPQFLEPNTMAISVMKHRHYGSHEGEIVRLRFDKGQLHDLNPRDMRSGDMRGYQR